MPICLNCGNQLRDGSKFCTKCGTTAPAEDTSTPIPAPPPYSGSTTSMPSLGFDSGYSPEMDEVMSEGPQKRAGLGFSEESFEESVTNAEAKKRELDKTNYSLFKRRKKDISIEEELGLFDEKKKEPSTPLLKRPEFWFILAAVAVLPAFLMPWFRFYDGAPLSAFRLPVVYLFFDKPDALRWLTVGLVLAVLFIVNLGLAIYPGRIINIFQVTSVVLFVVTAGMLLLGLRHWNAFAGLGAAEYNKYLSWREPRMPADPLPALTLMKFEQPATGTVSMPATATAAIPSAGVQTATAPLAVRIPAGTVRTIVFRKPPVRQPMPPKTPGVKQPAPPQQQMVPSAPVIKTVKPGIIYFLIKVLRPGILFALLSGWLLMWSSGRFAAGQRFIEYTVPPIAASAALFVGGILLATFLFARVFPARWYWTQSELVGLVGMRDTAKSRLETCTQKPVPNYLCTTSLARIYWKEGAPLHAYAMFNSVAKAQPDFPPVHKDLADMYFAGKNYWKAAQFYRKYLHMKPSDMKARKSMSAALIYIGDENNHRGRYRKAIEQYNEALGVLNVNKTDPVIHYKIAEGYARIGQWTHAAKHYKITADLKPTEFQSQVDAAQSHSRIRDYNSALFYYKRAIDLKPTDTRLYINVGNLYRDVWKDKASAAQWYTQGINVNSVSDASYEARRLLQNLQK